MLGCQYLGPEYDPRTHRGETPYCGSRVIEGKSYCHNHYYVIYKKGSAVAGRKKEKVIDAEIAQLELQRLIAEQEEDNA